MDETRFFFLTELGKMLIREKGKMSSLENYNLATRQYTNVPQYSSRHLDLLHWGPSNKHKLNDPAICHTYAHVRHLCTNRLIVYHC